MLSTLEGLDVVSSVSLSSDTPELLGITGNQISSHCMRTGQHPAAQYWDANGVWPRGHEDYSPYTQGQWDSSAMVCFDYVVFAPGSSSNYSIQSLTDSTVTLKTALWEKSISDITDSTHFNDRFIMFPTREEAPYHSLQRYRVRSAEARMDGNSLWVAAEVCENVVARTVLSDADALYNLGIRSGVASANPLNSVWIAGICNQLHWSEDSSDALCINSSYADGEMYCPGSCHRSDNLGWNLDGLQNTGNPTQDSTTNTGFYFDGLTLAPVVRNRMVFGTEESGSSGCLFHEDLAGTGDVADAVALYNVNNHNLWSNYMRQIRHPGEPLVSGVGLARAQETNWSTYDLAHFAQTASVVGARWNDKGTVGVAPGAKIDPECPWHELPWAGEYGAVDVAAFSHTAAFFFYGDTYYFDVVGDHNGVPRGSWATASAISNAHDDGVWVMGTPLGNFYEYHCLDTEVPATGAFFAWDGTTNRYAHGEMLDFVSPVPVAVAGPYYNDDTPSYTEYSGQSCTTPAGAASFLLMKEARPELDMLEARQIMASSCRPFPGMEGGLSKWHPYYGYGRPDMNVAISQDLTSAGCPPPRGLMVDGEGTGYAALRWTNPHYRKFEQTKILRKHDDNTAAYGVTAMLHGQSIAEYPKSPDPITGDFIGQEHSLSWFDDMVVSDNCLALTDSTFFAKCIVYFDYVASGHGYESSYWNHTLGMADWGQPNYNLITGPGDTTSTAYPTGMPEVRAAWSPTRNSPVYVIDDAGDWFDYFTSQLRTVAEHFYNAGTPIKGFFLDEFSNPIGGWYYILDVNDEYTTDRFGNNNNSDRTFLAYPGVETYYLASDEYIVHGYTWEACTIVEQRAIIWQWVNAVFYPQYEALEVELWDILNTYGADNPTLVGNGTARKMTNLGDNEFGVGQYVPTYGTSMFVESYGDKALGAKYDWDDCVGGDATEGEDPTGPYKYWRYVHPGDMIGLYIKGASRDWDDWWDGWGDGEALLEEVASFAGRRGCKIVLGYGETPVDGETGMSAVFNPNDVDDRWPFYTSAANYSTNHTDGTVVYEGKHQMTTDHPGAAGDYIYTGFSQDTYGQWSSEGIGLAMALKRKEKTVMTVESISPGTSLSAVYGSISPGGESFSVDGETAYNDSTVVPPLTIVNPHKHGQGWYAIGENSNQIYPIRTSYYHPEGHEDRGKFFCFETLKAWGDVEQLSPGDELTIKYLALHVGAGYQGEPHGDRKVTEDTFPRQPITLTASTDGWFTSFNPDLSATSSYDIANGTMDLNIQYLRNPMGIKDMYVYRYDGADPGENDWPQLTTYRLSTDSTDLCSFTEVDTYPTMVSYKIVPLSVNNQLSTNPVYLLNIPTGNIQPPTMTCTGFFLQQAPILSIYNPNAFTLEGALYRNGEEYHTLTLYSGYTTFYDLFWQEGHYYQAKGSVDEYTSPLSDSVTPEKPDYVATATSNADIQSTYYYMPLGDSTYGEYYDAGFDYVFETATQKMGEFRLGQPLWVGSLPFFQYRTKIIPTEYGGRSEDTATSAQFELWDSQVNGQLVYRYHVNPIEFEFDFGIRNKRLDVLDGPAKVQLMYQDHVLRSMLWRNIPTDRYKEMISILQSLVGRQLWLDAKDFTMPVTGIWPFQYAQGYRYLIEVVDVAIRPADGGGVRRGDIELRYKMLTTQDGGM